MAMRFSLCLSALLFGSVALAFAGCDDDEGGIDESSTDSTSHRQTPEESVESWRKYCAARAERADGCDNDHNAASYEACVAKAPNCAAFLNAAGVDRLAACLSECGSEDPCYEDATNAVPEYADFRTACLAKQQECALPADYCYRGAILSTRALELIWSCLADCNAASDCIEKTGDVLEACN
jgi:hypothetical protein